jgi:Xaa-Pro aminopeptidase
MAGAILFHSRDVFYYTGTAQPAYLVVLPDDYSLYIRRGYEIACRECFLPAERVVDAKSFDASLRSLFPGPGTGEKIGVEMDLITLSQAQSLKKALGDREFADVSGIVLEQRMTKDPAEVGCIRKACAAIHAGHHAAMACLRPGLTELELTAAIEYAQRLAGHEGCFFMRAPEFVMSRGPLASGPNLRETSGTLFALSGVGLSSAIPTSASRRIMEQGDLVLVDIPACIEGYHGDQSRTYSVGAASQKAKEMFGKIREIADTIIRAMVPGAPCSELFRLAHAKAEELGEGDDFLRFASGARAHFIGHGIGLEINEPPVMTAGSKVALKDGMVLALELHLLEAEGLAMKLEDTILVTGKGVEILTESPRELNSREGYYDEK